MTHTQDTQDKYTEQLSLWLDDELSGTEVAQLQHHLRHCHTCQQTYQGLQQVDGWLRSAATVMAAPAPGFVQRVETRLAQVQPQKMWHIWLAVMALVFGALFFVGAGAVFGGLTVYNTGSTVLNTQLVHQGLVSVIDSANTARFLLELGSLLLRTSLITMQQPIFWGMVLMAGLLAAVWVQIMRMALRRGIISTNLMVY